MIPYREIIELRSIGLSLEKVAFLTGAGIRKVADVTARAAELGLQWPVPAELSEWELAQLIDPPRSAVRHVPDCPAIYRAVRDRRIAAKPSKRHLDAAWEIYLASAEGAELPPYARAGFESLYRAWLRDHLRRPWMLVNWTPAESVQVDWAGRTIPLHGKGGDVTPAYLFVATLPYSDYTFVRASLDMSMQSWLEHHRAMFEFIGGVPLFLTPDNVLTAVTYDPAKPSFQNPDRTVNRRYQDMADHYGVIVAPTRVKAPTDKAAVEVSVRHAANRFVGILEGMRFTSIDQLNTAIAELTAVLNDRRMGSVGRGLSRREIFEQEEAPHLAPLPEAPFESVTWEKSKASKDAVIRVRGVWYGLPEACAGVEVSVRVSDRVVEAYTRDRAQLLARHVRREDGSDTFEGFAGRRPDRFKPLDEWAAQNGRSTILEQWHPDRNGGLTPRGIMCRSTRKVWWQCPDCGYEWLEPPKTRTRRTWDDCLACANVDLVPGRNDLATLRPDIAAEWHPERNGCEPSDVFPEHRLPVWWKGAECGHEWLCPPKKRTASAVGALCPYCSGREALAGFNDVATLAPELAKIWHPVKNRGRKPDGTPACSGSRAYLLSGPFGDIWLESPRSWIERNGQAHVLAPFDRVVAEARAKDAARPAAHTVPDPNATAKHLARGVRQRWLQEEPLSFGQWCERFSRGDLASQWHPERNGGLSPHDVANGAMLEAWWRCELGHEWQAPVRHRQLGFRDCPRCMPAARVTPGVNDLATRSGGFVRLYSPKNPLPPDMVSDRHVGALFWLCPECAHEWELPLDSFPKNRPSCPRCDGWEPAVRETVPGMNDLATRFPYVAAFWHPARNGGEAPQAVAPYSTKDAWWLCPDCGHEWREPVASCAAHRNSPCPACAEARDERRREEAERRARAREERALKRAETRELKQKQAEERALRKRKRAAARKAARPRGGFRIAVVPGWNDLATTHPELAAQWHPTKNGALEPSHVAAGSGKPAWWACALGHEWQAPVNSRAVYGNNCPYCGHRRILPGFNDLATNNPGLAAEWNHERNGKLKPTDVMPGSNRVVWWRCRECGEEWQAPVKERSKGRRKCSKCNPARHNAWPAGSGGRAARPAWSIADARPDLVKEWNYERNGGITPDQVPAGSPKSYWWKCSLGHEWPAIVANRTRGNTDCPYCANRKVLVGFNDLTTKRPDVAKDWHPTKNGDLKPTDVTFGSNKKAWWRCSACGDEREAMVNDRSRRGCPECAKKAALKKGVRKRPFLEERPDLASEWHPTKNEGVKPESLSAGSSQIAWWQCELGHEWPTAVEKRVLKGSNCPYCTNQKVLAGFNDLASMHPEIAAQWHPTKNVLKPTEVTFGTAKKYWWLCRECSHEWEQAVEKRTRKGHVRCPNCGALPREKAP